MLSPEHLQQVHPTRIYVRRNGRLVVRCGEHPSVLKFFCKIVGLPSEFEHRVVNQ